jgi:Cu(I)/Ag(I) efflux system membrane fusion protein
MKFIKKQNIIWLVLIPLAFILGLWLNSGSDASVQPAQTQTAAAAQGTIWTCSMHPQIRQNHSGKCPICGMDLIPVTDSGSNQIGYREIQLSPRAQKLADIETTPVKRMNVSGDRYLVGKVTYDETRLGYIASRVDGRIDRMYADYTGTVVRAGDKLVDLYSPELLSTQQELLEAQKLLRQNPDPKSVIYRSAQKNISAVRERLRLWGFSDQQIASIEKAQQPSDHLTIYAPLSGTVIHKNAVEGAYVKTGMNIYTIADLSEVWVMLEAYETDLPFLKLGQTVEFTSESKPGETFTGKISFIDPVLNDQSRTVNLRVQANNHRDHLKPDMFVHAVVKTHPETGATPPLVIPASATLITGKRAVVYVAESGKEGVFQGRDITLGPRAGDYYIVKDGLKEGENVVTNGAFKIDSEAQILAKPSMMNPRKPAAKPGAGTTKSSFRPSFTM